MIQILYKEWTWTGTSTPLSINCNSERDLLLPHLSCHLLFCKHAAFIGKHLIFADLAPMCGTRPPRGPRKVFLQLLCIWGHYCNPKSVIVVLLKVWNLHLKQERKNGRKKEKKRGLRIKRCNLDGASLGKSTQKQERVHHLADNKWYPVTRDTAVLLLTWQEYFYSDKQSNIWSVYLACNCATKGQLKILEWIHLYSYFYSTSPSRLRPLF